MYMAGIMLSFIGPSGTFPGSGLDIISEDADTYNNAPYAKLGYTLYDTSDMSVITGISAEIRLENTAGQTNVSAPSIIATFSGALLVLVALHRRRRHLTA